MQASNLSFANGWHGSAYPCPHTCMNTPCRRQLRLACRAAKRGGSASAVTEKLGSLFTKVGSKKSEEAEDRFKYDFANSRWVRVKPERDADGKYTSENWEKGDATVITPKSGTPYTVWPVIHAKLTRRGLKSVPPAEAERLLERGATVLDVRPAYQFEAERVAGAVNVPMFRKVAGTGNWDNLKKVVMRFGLAMEATERDPNFAKNAAAVLNKRKKVIVYCGRGGTIEVGAKPWAPGRKYFKDDPEKMFGIESRSLKACHELLEEGFKDVVHLEGGLSQWRHDGYPIDGK